MTALEFCKEHPQLYHMATANALATIKRHGLLSTSAILKLLKVEEAVSVRLTTERRSEMTRLDHHELGTFHLRDQKPLRDEALRQCLDDMTVPEWYSMLNTRVFFWATRDRVDRLLAARAYRREDQLLLTIDSAPFVNKYFSTIEVTTMNSGATLYKPLRRGRYTFVPISQFAGGKVIVEVTVPQGVPDLADYLLDFQVRKGEK